MTSSNPSMDPDVIDPAAVDWEAQDHADVVYSAIHGVREAMHELSRRDKKKRAKK